MGDTDAFMIENITELFTPPGSKSGELLGELTWEDFESRLEHPRMREYFKAIDVHPSDAKGVFRLLDLDDSGSIDANEFLSGCLRLRGNAKALDVAVLMHEVRRLASRF